MSRILTKYGNLLENGKFVSRYGFKGDPSKIEISTELIKSMTLDRYSRYLNFYNCFVLLRPRDSRFHLRHKNLLWRSFCRDTSSLYDKESTLQSVQNPTSAPSPVFFEKPPKMALLNELLGCELNDNGKDCFCFFQNLDSLHSTAAFRQYLERTKSSKSVTDFEPVAVAINMDDHSSPAISYIQPLLEDSAQIYSDLNYEKLLRIAKHSQTKSSDPMRKEVKRILEAFAENGFLIPRMAKRGRWLLLTAESPAVNR
ncbi:Cbt1p LALA0_S07e03510g [Lachancea lanzarotensis]|uniref:LALA0S07e03510g1_1 n=1 Tax=Lachancea lanzarotensis TaxID=1245769 RepID=A0A0C7NC42_9SACH|nr:uncharacterized protein LALA0_S07e03510g [Lachancea lanzarotensis]CEP63149.1 LALA0S07e03510g1_1 [Lachancea lanzarotensis]